MEIPMEYFSGYEYLLIAVANAFGHDKKLWKERIQWTEENCSKLSFEDADEPAMAYSALKTLKAYKEGNTSTNFSIALDATASGAQIYSAVSHCLPTAEMCNVVDTGMRGDLYTLIYKALQERINDPEVKIIRDDVKKVIMRGYYGSEKTKRDIFGEDTPLALAFDSVMGEKSPNAWKLRQMFIDIWPKDILEFEWEMPDGFQVHQPITEVVDENLHFNNAHYIVKVEKKYNLGYGRAFGPNFAHSVDGFFVRELIRQSHTPQERIQWLKERFLYDKIGSHPHEKLERLIALGRKTGFMSSKVLKYAAPETMGHMSKEEWYSVFDRIPSATFDIIPVHDSFRVHCNNGNRLRIMYNRLLADLSRSTLLLHVLESVLRKKVNLRVPPIEGFYDRILASNYALS